MIQQKKRVLLALITFALCCSDLQVVGDMAADLSSKLPSALTDADAAAITFQACSQNVLCYAVFFLIYDQNYTYLFVRKMLLEL